ncbi:MAG: DnaA regulatory inactivator Hda [Betaproteobacteria bacterium]|jgi:DnaA family protein|nr:DnaA regulatory inactivator Hda [Burkholderiales bacterium]
MKQIALDIGVSVGPSLGNFHPGHNAAALAHLELWMAGRTRSPVPTFLWGDNGSGKTHLLRAVADHIRNQGARVGWMDKTTVQPPEFNPEWEVLLLDDVQFFSAVQQHMAFNWFVNAATPGAARQPWVLAAGSLPPQDLPLREDLRTRLGWGHVFHLQLLDDDQRREVLLKHAQALGMHLGKDLLDYLLSRFSRDLGHLIHLLEQLDNYALQTQRPLTIPLLRAMLDET